MNVIKNITEEKLPLLFVTNSTLTSTLVKSTIVLIVATVFRMIF